MTKTDHDGDLEMFRANLNKDLQVFSCLNRGKLTSIDVAGQF